MTPLINALRDGRDLSSSEVRLAVAALLSDETPDEEKADFLILLHRKGESTEEIVAFVHELLARAIDPQIDQAALPGPMLDNCGTGGDGFDLFNVSTTVMFVLAAADVVVMKHGNRGATSRCGSADVLEALGVEIDLAPAQLRESLKRCGLGFVFARRYHPAFRALAELRQRLAAARQRTIFNLLGPLLSPGRPTLQFVGVYEPRLTSVFADVLRLLGRKRAWIVHGNTDAGGIDDISTAGITTLAELADGRLTNGIIDARWLGLSESRVEELYGGDARENARILEGILDGSIGGAKRDLALVNAAGGFVVAGVASDIRVGLEMAREQIDSGRALAKLRALQQFQPNASR
ncbi:MAG: anthranilate phosphoribosyltransferase [Chthoniobacterales bacterium]